MHPRVKEFVDRVVELELQLGVAIVPAIRHCGLFLVATTEEDIKLMRNAAVVDEALEL